MFGELEQLSRNALCATQTILNRNQFSISEREKQSKFGAKGAFPQSAIDLCSCTLLRRGQVHLQDRKSADIGGFNEWTRKKDIYICPIKKWTESKTQISPNLCQ